MFSWEFSKLLHSINFWIIFVCVEEFNYIKDYMEVMLKERAEGQHVHIF